jgi:uncharacterized protein YeeX (DUF496 family)
MGKRGTVDVIVTLYFEQDLSEDTIQDIIAEMDYSFDHKLIGHYKIKDLQ